MLFVVVAVLLSLLLYSGVVSIAAVYPVISALLVHTTTEATPEQRQCGAVYVIHTVIMITVVDLHPHIPYQLQPERVRYLSYCFLHRRSSYRALSRTRVCYVRVSIFSSL